MCGICGVVEPPPGTVAQEELQAMTRSLAHRGPDDEGLYRGDGVGLGSRRLSIIDLSSAGRMPIFNESRTIAVIQNGEIYNFAALRQDLLGKGHRFRGRSDTEVLVHLYEELGEECFARLDGMYAIAIWDAARRRLLLARDRFGEKPLYYAAWAGRLAFASELKSLLLYPCLRHELDWDALDQFLTLGYILAPRTPYRNVAKLLPGHYLTFDQPTGELQLHAYWTPPPTSNLQSPGTAGSNSERDSLDRFTALLRESVRSRLVSDVPIGAFLSGGIDSSLVVGAMAQLHGGPVRTFSIGFQAAARHDENPIAEAVAGALGVEHRALNLTLPDVLAVIEQLPWLSDEPLGDPALIGIALISRFARSHGVTVMLSGDGGDELFWGYPVYRWADWLGTIYHHPALVRVGLSMSASLAARLSNGSRWEKMGEALRQPGLWQAAYYLTGYGAWSFGELARLREPGAASICARPFQSAFGEAAPNGRPMARQAAAMLQTYLPDNNLARMDRASMAHGVETRAPFLHPALAEFAAALPVEMKIRGRASKILLRRALAELLPEALIRRPKHGFDALPMAAWLRGDLNFLVREYLDPARLKRQGVYNPAVVTARVSEHEQGGRFNHWWKLWLLIVLQMWLERWANV